MKTEEDDLILKQNFFEKNRCFKNNSKIQPKGILLHSPAVAGLGFDWFERRWNSVNANVCVHVILTPLQCIQILPWNCRSWGCGKGKKGSANGTHIQIEVCEPSGHKYVNHKITGYDVEKNEEYFKKILKRTVDLCCILCKMHNIPSKNICDHSEAAKMGLASNHKDLSHWFNLHGVTMDDVRKMCQEKLKD